MYSPRTMGGYFSIYYSIRKEENDEKSTDNFLDYTRFSVPGIWHHRQSTLLKVFNPWQGAENTETTLFIVRNGEKIPAGFTGQVVKAGARRIVCLSSTYVAMLDALGQVDRVVGVSGRNYISNKYVTTHPEAVADIGFDGNIDYELLLAQRPDRKSVV